MLFRSAPIFIAFCILLGTTMFRPAPKDLAHLIALSAALILGIQFWYADHGGIYVLWYLPLLVLLLIRPNCSERLPPLIDRNTDWLHRAIRGIQNALRRPSPAPAQTSR